MDTATNPIPAILDLLREDRLIEAIKIFRTTYGGGLREAKDAVEAIRHACLPHGGKPVEYLVVSRMVADGLVDYRAEVVVASVVASSVVTRHMQEVGADPGEHE
ncbi:hypothetical protein [Bradyrhizobium yuanmingense]|uniref:hypothetical protein n=1 Tax=Bradyrhizobium yuanmingense TaxID=108015 RepID=UPI0004ACA553|nr:hypothetical protein [Bradyrhizobium yuanmingense]